MRIASFDDLVADRIATGGEIHYSTGSNGGDGDLAGGGDVVGYPGAYSVVGLRSSVALASNLSSGVAIGDVLTIIQTSPALARFAASSNGGGGGDTTGQLIVNWDGGNLPLQIPAQVDLVAPYTGTITGWTMLADQTGSAVVDIWADTYANFPPTIADTITGSAKPTLSGATKATSTTLTGWTTAITAGRTYRFTLDSAATLTRLALVVDYTRP